MKLYLIRHGKTYGNTLNRYIGSTDEPLCEEGIRLLMSLKNLYPDHPERLYVSPLSRCRETAEILFDHSRQIPVEDLRECDFGEFENKNYLELSDNQNYQAWIDSGGTLPFPEGESVNDFKNRCCQAFLHVLEDLKRNSLNSAVLVVHGGTIMSIMERFAIPHSSYYDFHVSNGEGYLLEETSEGFAYQKLSNRTYG